MLVDNEVEAYKAVRLPQASLQLIDNMPRSRTVALYRH